MKLVYDLHLNRIGLVALMALCLVGCNKPNDNNAATTTTFHFKMRGDSLGLEDFRAATKDQNVIAYARGQLAMPEADRQLHIAGPVDYGNGGLNLDWNWHFIADSWELVEVSVELCDTGPVLISQCVECWVSAPDPGACPWGSYVAYEVSN